MVDGTWGRGRGRGGEGVLDVIHLPSSVITNPSTTLDSGTDHPKFSFSGRRHHTITNCPREGRHSDCQHFLTLIFFSGGRVEGGALCG